MANNDGWEPVKPRAADGWEPVKPRAPVAVAPAVKPADGWEPVKPKASADGWEAITAKPIAEEVPLVNSLRNALDVNQIANVPTALGLRKPVGADRTQQMQRIERERGIPLGVRVVDPNESKSGMALQFAANTTAGIAAVMGAGVQMSVEAGAAVARELGEGGALALRPLWSNPEIEKHIASAAARGDVSLTAEGHGRRLLARGQEAIKSLAEGASPAVTNALLAAPGQRTQAFLDGMFAFPVESLLGIGHAAKFAAGVKGGARSVDVSLAPGTNVPTPEQIVNVPLSDIRNKPVTMNAAGWRAYDLTPEAMKPYVWDIDNPKATAQRSALETAKAVARDSKSPAMTRLAEIQAVAPGVLSKAVDDISAEFERVSGKPLDAGEKVRVLEGSLHGGDTGINKSVRHIDLTPEMQQARQKLGATLVENGVDPETAKMILTYTTRASMSRLKGGVQTALAPEMLPAGRETFEAPHEVLDALHRKISTADPADRPALAQSLVARAQVLENDPRWVAVMSRPETVGEYTWHPLSESEGISKYRTAQAAGVEHARAAAAQLQNMADVERQRGNIVKADALDAQAKRRAATQFNVQDYERGALAKDTAFDIWKDTVGDIAATPEGQAKVAMMLAADPMSRFTAAKNAPAHAKWLAARLSDPNAPEFRFRQEISRASQEIADKMGLSPTVIAGRLDQYISHALADAMSVQHTLLDTMNPTNLQRILSFQGARYKRALSDVESNTRYAEAIMKGELDLSQVVQETINRIGTTAQMIHHWSEFYDTAKKAGILSDHEVKGWRKTLETEAAPGKQAASSDPYNFMFGKMAGKWMPPELASQMGLIKEALTETNPLMQTFKMAKTIYSPLGYQMRNHVTDMVKIAVNTGVPLEGPAFRRGWEATVSDVHRYMSDIAAGRPPRASPLLAEAIANGHFQPDRIASIVDNGDQSMGRVKATKAAMDLAARVTVEPTAKSLPMMQQIVAHALSVGHVFLPKVWLNSVKGLRESVKAFNEAMAEVRRDEQYKALGNVEGFDMNRLGAAVEKTWMLGYHGLRALNHELTDTWLAKWTAQEEATRRMFSYRLARTEMGMTPEQAVAFVDKTVYGAGARPMWQQRLNASDVPMAPFYEYGIWAAQNGFRRTMNDPKLFAMHLLAQGMHAYNEEASAEDEKDNKSYWARMGFALISSAGANNVIIGDSKDLANAYDAIGVPLLAKAMRGADLSYVLPLRDLAGLNAMGSDIDLSRPGAEVLARMHPAADAALMLMDPNAYRLSRRRGADPLDANGVTEGKTYTLFANALAILGDADALEKGLTAMKGVKNLATGEQQRRGKTGERIDPTSAIESFLTPVVRMTTVDKVAMIKRLKGAETGEVRSMADRSWKYTSQLDPYDPDDKQAIKVEKTALKFEQKLIALKFTRVAGWAGADVKIKRLLDARDKALTQLRNGKDADQNLLHIPDIDATIERFGAAAEKIINEVTDGYSTSGQPDPTAD